MKNEYLADAEHLMTVAHECHTSTLQARRLYQQASKIARALWRDSRTNRALAWEALSLAESAEIHMEATF